MGNIMNSLKKSKAMKKAEKIMTSKMSLNFNAMMKRSEDEEAAFKELFITMKAFDDLVSVIDCYNTNPEELKSLASRIHMTGYEYQKSDFLPIALLSFPKPLAFILENKSQLMDHGFEEVRFVVEEAKKLL